MQIDTISDSRALALAWQASPAGRGPLMHGQVISGRDLANFGAVPVATPSGGPITQAISAAVALLSQLGVFTDKKKLYHDFDPVAIQAVQAYGPDIVTGSAALKLNVNEVAQAASEYLAAAGVRLTPQQLLANANAGNVKSGIGANLAPYILGGGALIAVMIMLRKHGR